MKHDDEIIDLDFEERKEIKGWLKSQIFSFAFCILTCLMLYFIAEGGMAVEGIMLTAFATMWRHYESLTTNEGE